MNSDILVKRQIFTNKSTIGFLTLDNFHCWTLEDKDRGLQQEMPIELVNKVKIKDLTCIPYGRYEVITNFSNRFKKIMPLLLNVKGFEGIRIHSGNKAEDTEGCILLGKGLSQDFVNNSRQAFLEFMNILNHKLELGKIFINITK